MTKKKKICIGILVSIPIVMAIAVALISGPIGRKYINEHGEDYLGRKVYVEDFSLNIFTGNVSLGDLRIYEKNGDSVFATIDDIDLNLSMIDLITGKIHVEDLDIDHPVVNVVQKDTTFNFDDIMAFMASDDSESSEYTIDCFSLEDGEINYQDRTFPTVPFSYSIKDFEVDIKNFNTADHNHIEICGELGENGKFEAVYDGLLADQNNMGLTLSLKDVDLVGLSPLFVQIFGREVLSGTLDLNTEIAAVNGKISGNNHVTITDAKVQKVKGLPFKPEYRKVPLKNALYVLTDKYGKCEMDLKVSGRKDDPKFSYKRALMKAFGKGLLKIVTSPFSRNDDEDD